MSNSLIRSDSDNELKEFVPAEIAGSSQSQAQGNIPSVFASWSSLSVKVGLFLLGSILAPIVWSGFVVLNASLMNASQFVVDKEKCTCDCWDGRYRGYYNRGGYKAYFFNFDVETMYSLIVVVIGTSLFKDYIQKVCVLFYNKTVRVPSFIGTLFLIHPIWYGSWALLNYFNEFSYSASGFSSNMYRAQIFFLATEIIVAFIFFQNMDSSRAVHEPSLFLALFLSIMHIILALREKVLWGLIWPGESNVGRDILLVSTDLASIICSSAIVCSFSCCNAACSNIVGNLPGRYRSQASADTFSSIKSTTWFRPAVGTVLLTLSYFLFFQFE